MLSLLIQRQNIIFAIKSLEKGGNDANFALL